MTQTEFDNSKLVRIIKMEGLFGRDETEDFKKFGLKIGDEIKVKPFVTNAVSYQPIPKGEVLFIYTWNIEEIKLVKEEGK